jgi:hypothetical protein
MDFNQSHNWAIRLTPELLFTDFGTSPSEFFSISGGVLYRFGKR